MAGWIDGFPISDKLYMSRDYRMWVAGGYRHPYRRVDECLDGWMDGGADLRR